MRHDADGAAALVVVEITPHGYDKFVWLVAAALLAVGATAWHLQHWPARPWFVLVVSSVVIVVGYAAWLWWYAAAHPPQSD